MASIDLPCFEIIVWCGMQSEPAVNHHSSMSTIYKKLPRITKNTFISHKTQVIVDNECKSRVYGLKFWCNCDEFVW